MTSADCLLVCAATRAKTWLALMVGTNAVGAMAALLLPGAMAAAVDATLNGADPPPAMGWFVPTALAAILADGNRPHPNSMHQREPRRAAPSAAAAFALPRVAGRTAIPRR